MRRSLTKQDRLKRPEDFKRVFESPLRFGCAGARLAALSNSFDKTRFGVGLSKKFGNAVTRNHAKRQIREIFRHQKHRIKPGFDLVFLAYPGDFSFQDRERQFSYLIDKAGLSTESR